MSLLTRLLHGCWFAHDHMRERGARGSYWLVCTNCGDRQQVLPKQRLKVKKPARMLRIAERKRA